MNTSSYTPVSILAKDYVCSPNFLKKDISRLSRNETMALCCRLNAVIASTEGRSFQETQVRILAGLESEGWLENRDAKKIIRYLEAAQSEGLHPVCFNRPMLLEMLRWTALLASDSVERERVLSVSHLRHAFIRALLCCSELYGDREISPVLAPSSKPASRITYVPFLRRAAAWGDLRRDPLLSLGRMDLLLIKHFINGFGYEGQFLRAYGMSIEEWLICHVVLLLIQMKHDEIATTSNNFSNLYEWNPKAIMAEIPQHKPAFDAFVERLSQSVEQFQLSYRNCSLEDQQEYSLLPVHQKPILKIAPDRFIIIDMRCFLEQMLAGPIFSLSGNSAKSIQDYGLACQNYAYELLSSANRAAKGIVPYLFNEPSGEPNAISDILIADSSTAVLLEVKGVWLSEKTLVESEPELFWSEIKAKYSQPKGIGKNGKSTGAKGVYQLADGINALAGGRTLGTDIALSSVEVTEIIPAIVVHDALIAEALFTRLLAEDFRTAMGIADINPNSRFVFDRFAVHDLIVVSLYDLETLAATTSDWTVLEVFQAYSAAVPARNTTFSEFLTRQHREKHLKYSDADHQLVRRQAIDVMRRVAEACFKTDISAQCFKSSS